MTAFGVCANMMAFRGGDSLQADGGLLRGVSDLLALAFLLRVAGPLFHEDLFEVFLSWSALEFGFGCDEAVVFVEDDVGHGFGGGSGGFGQVAASDLKGVEEQAGALGVEDAGGDAADDLAEGELNGGAVFGFGQGEGGLMAAAVIELRLRDGFAGGVVVVAKYFSAEGGRAAAMAGDVDVATLETNV